MEYRIQPSPDFLRIHKNLRGIGEYLKHDTALPGMNRRTVDGSSVVFGHHKQCAFALPKVSECRKEASIGPSDKDEVEATNGCKKCGSSEAEDMVGGEGVSGSGATPSLRVLFWCTRQSM